MLITSAAARMGVAETTVYAANKAGLEAFARVWATELGQSHGITVNCVSPGPIATDQFHNSSPEFKQALQPMIESTPAEARMGEVEDIVPLVRQGIATISFFITPTSEADMLNSFLCSEESRWVTGSVLSGTGGLLF